MRIRAIYMDRTYFSYATEWKNIFMTVYGFKVMLNSAENKFTEKINEVY